MQVVGRRLHIVLCRQNGGPIKLEIDNAPVELERKFRFQSGIGFLADLDAPKTG